MKKQPSNEQAGEIAYTLCQLALSPDSLAVVKAAARLETEYGADVALGIVASALAGLGLAFKKASAAGEVQA